MKNPANTDTKNDKFWLWPFLVAVTAWVITFGYFWCKFRNAEVSETLAPWGQLGDYLGGVLNPIIGLLTVWLLTINLKVTKSGLTKSNELFSNQNNNFAHAAKFNNAITLYENLENRLERIYAHCQDFRYLEEGHQPTLETPERAKAYQVYKYTVEQKNRLNEIIEREFESITSLSNETAIDIETRQQD